MSARNARLLLLGAMVVLGAALAWLGKFEPVVVLDTKLYTDFPLNSLNSALSNHRTPLYPLVLEGVRTITGDYQLAPSVHYIWFCAGVYAVFAGLFALTGRPWISAMAAASLLSANILHLYVRTIATDTVAAASAIAAVGLLMLAISGKGNRWVTYALLSLVAASAWLFRPAYLFLVPLLPLLGVCLAILQRSGERPVNLMKTCAWLCGVSGLPLLAWCLFRWMVIGAFGVVALGGYNLVGITGQLLTEDMVARLPEHLHPLARAALEERAQLRPDQISMPNADPLNYMRLETNYDDTIWRVYAPAATRLYGDDHLAVNINLSQLAVEIVKVRPKAYAIWLVKATRQCLKKIVADFVTNPFGMLLTLLAVAVTFVSLLRRPGTSNAGLVAHHRPMATAVLFVCFTLYSAAMGITTILVCPPLGRMTDAIAVLLPAVVMAVVLERAHPTNAH